jgi:hypothetical protein
MTSRALARAGLQPVPHIDLPVEPYPQQWDLPSARASGVDDTVREAEDEQQESSEEDLLTLAER